VSNGDIQAAMNWYGSVRGRLGYLITPKLLVYGSGGLSYGGVFAQTNFRSVSNYIDAYGVGLGKINYAQMASGKGQATDTLIGWTAGAGMEWMFSNKWSLKTEAFYYDLGNLNLSGVGYSPSTQPNTYPNYQSINTNTRIRYDGVITRLGVNYHFDLGKELPIVAKY
ncbi:MAG: outer membrane protein, partial [Methylocystis sp.]